MQTIAGIPAVTYEGNSMLPITKNLGSGGVYAPTGGASTPSTYAPPVSTGTVAKAPANGLMAMASGTPLSATKPTAQASAATYNASGYTPTDATTNTYKPATGNASTYDATNVDRAGTTYDPTQQAVQGNQLVSNQLTDLTSGNNKYIQDARQTGLEQAAKSGLMTSSIAAGNSERAAVQAALPIAQADAARYGSVADQNMAAANQAGQYNAGATLNASTTDANAANTAGQFDAQSQNSMTQANMDAANTAGQFNANAGNQTSQFNANSGNQASAYNANASNEAGQYNAGQINSTSQFNTGQTNNNQLAYSQLGAQQSNLWYGTEQNREQEMSAVMQSIYSNSNLTPAQQEQAAANAKTVFQGLWNATDATFAQGVPDVFTHV